VPSPTTAAHEEKILRRLFHRYPGGLAARLPSGATLTLGAHAPEFTLVFKHPGMIRDLILSQDPLQLAEAYFSDRVDFEGDIYRVISVKDHLQSLTLSAFDKAALAGAASKLRKPDDGTVHKDAPSGVTVAALAVFPEALQTRRIAAPSRSTRRTNPEGAVPCTDSLRR
jgi:hypothetical protein